MSRKDAPSVLSLFSGAGGMDLGLSRAGFAHVGLVEFGARQRETLSENTAWPLLGTGDVNDLAVTLKPEDLGINIGDLDLLAGGPPCQPFSMAAQWAARGRQGMLDERARTVPSTLQLVRSFLPKAVLFENVIGFIQGPRSAIDYLKEEFANISSSEGVHYTLQTCVVNSADYGVPQNRKRAIVVAMRDDREFAWPSPTHRGNPVTAWEALWDVEVSAFPVSRGKWTELLPSIPEGGNYLWLTSKGGGSEIFGYRTKYWNFLLKLAKDAPSWTLSASPGPSTGPFHWDNRPLAVEEQLRLQTFPDNWFISGNYREQTLQVGNATPVLLAEKLGLSIRAALSLEDPEYVPLVKSRSIAPPFTSSPPKPVPLKFGSLVGAKEAHAGEGRGPARRPSLASDQF